MPTPLQYEVPLPPAEFLERLHNETVSFQIFHEMLRKPGQSYAKLVRESVSGPKKLMSKIDGNKFRLINIGIWPFKGPMISPSLGAIHGSVEESTTGSTIQAQFKRGPQSLMLLLLFGVLCPLVFSIFPIILWIYKLEGRHVFLVTGIITDLVGILAVAYVIVGARKQAKFTREVLDELVAGMTEEKQVTSAD